METSKRGRGRGRPPKTPVKEDLPSAETKDTETTSNAEEEDTVIVQAGEGDSTKLSEPPKRGRGRPKKILPESSTPADNAEAEPEPEEYEASSSEEVPRTIAELASAQKRSRGRPKKEQPEAVEASTQTVESTYPEAAASEDVSTVAPKARGRPPKKGKGLAGPVEPAPHTSKEDNEQDDDNTTAAGEDAIRVASAVGELFEESSGIHDQVEAATGEQSKVPNKSLIWQQRPNNL